MVLPQNYFFDLTLEPKLYCLVFITLQLSRFFSRKLTPLIENKKRLWASRFVFATSLMLLSWVWTCDGCFALCNDIRCYQQRGNLPHKICVVKYHFYLFLICSWALFLFVCVSPTSRDYNYAHYPCQGDFQEISTFVLFLAIQSAVKHVPLLLPIPYYI